MTEKKLCCECGAITEGQVSYKGKPIHFECLANRLLTEGETEMKLDKDRAINGPLLDLFKTADYGVAGYLLACGFALASVQGGGSQLVFCFQNAPELVAAVGDYTSNKPIPCRDYFRALRRAKSIIQGNIHNKEEIDDKEREG